MTKEDALPFAYFHKKVVPFEEAKISIASHSLQYGTTCFGGIRGYVNLQGEAKVFRLYDHFVRLNNVMRLLGMDIELAWEHFEDNVIKLIKANVPKTDFYIRPFIYSEENILTPCFEEIRFDLAIYMIPLGHYFDPLKGLRLIVSSWRKVSDHAIPTKAKAGGSYVNSALARSEANRNGYDDALMMDEHGMIVEASAANLFIVYRGEVIMQNNEKKIPVAILGATGMVGQKFVELLSAHPWFKIVALAASERSCGQKYQDAMRWMMTQMLPKEIAEMIVSPCIPDLPCKIVFSGLDSSVAGEIEENFAQAGYLVISNSRNHRMDRDVPLMVPEVNSHHLDLVKTQSFSKGMIVTNPNCSVIGLTCALKPLVDRWGVEMAHVVTLQAISGAGYPGVPSFDIVDNVIPYISGEEEKVESEPLKILGSLKQGEVVPYSMRLSAQCNRVNVMDGHLACVAVKFRDKADAQEIIHAWQSFSSEAQLLSLPSAPKTPIVYHVDERHPQPKLHRNLESGMVVSIGRLRKCPLLDWKFALLSHNTVRGAAGCALLNAELMVKKGYL